MLPLCNCNIHSSEHHSIYTIKGEGKAVPRGKADGTTVNRVRGAAVSMGSGSQGQGGLGPPMGIISIIYLLLY